MSVVYVCAIFAVAFYTAAVFSLLLRSQSSHFWYPAAWGGMILHALTLISLLFTAEGIDLSFFSTAALVSGIIVFLFLLVALHESIDKLGLVILPLAATTLILRLIFASQVRVLGNLTLALQGHILVSLLAFSLLNIAAVQALILACQDIHLHRRRTGWFVRSLPPLETMETLLFQMVKTGFFLLSLSLITGALFIEDLLAQHLVHKTVLSILSWLVFGGLLIGRKRYGWRGRTAIRWTLGGFLALLLAYFGSKLVLELILHRT